MTTPTKMTIHRALSELKLIDSRIERQIQDLQPVGIYQKGKLINGHITTEQFAKSAESVYNSTVDLITRKNLIKSAIVTANGSTKLNVAGREMTIADAINYKNSIVLKRGLIMSMKRKHQQTVGTLQINNERVEKNLQVILEATFGKDVKAGKDDLEAVRKPFIEANEFHLCDPIKSTELIEKLEKDIDNFESEVDACLSEINAVTFITV